MTTSPVGPVLGAVPLTGPRPALLLLIVVAAGVALWLPARRSPRRRGRGGTGAVLAAVAGVALVAVAANTVTSAYPTLSDLLGTPRYPTVDQLNPASTTGYEQGAVARIAVPDTASHFGLFDAQVYLPPQYFSQPEQRFPVVVLAHGNPGTSTEWLDGGSAAQTGLAVARSGRPVILVMPTVLKTPTGDSLCVDTESQGHAATYVVTDVVAAADTQLRTIPDAAHRAIGGFSMGGFCALNLGLKHPDVFSVVLAFSSLTVCEPDAIVGGNEALFGGGDWASRVAENSPAGYYESLDPARGPALWLDVGESETDLVGPLADLATGLEAKGFTVELHRRPGGHDYATWTAALEEALPWAAQRL